MVTGSLRLAGRAAGAGLLTLVAACGASGSEGSASSGSGPQVVASFYPLQYVAQRLVGQHGDVGVLTTPGAEPHDLELTIAQTAEVADADVVVYLSGLQPAVDEAVARTGSGHDVDAADAAGLVPLEEHSHHADNEEHETGAHETGAHETGEEPSHDHGDLDPHFWLDPNRLADVAAALEARLAKAAPEHAAAYAANLAALRTDLEQLDAELAAGLDSCRIDTVVVSHDAFGYLGDRYGLDLHSINGLSPDAEPSPAHLRELAELIEQEGITTVFSETLATTALADTLAGELALETAVLDPVEGLSEDTAGKDYLSLMRANLAALRAANDCR